MSSKPVTTVQKTTGRRKSSNVSIYCGSTLNHYCIARCSIISELVSKIYQVVENGYDVTPAQAEEFGKGLSDLISNRLKERLEGDRPFTLRMSNNGKGTRQHWLEQRYPIKDRFDGKTLLKFIIGDITEHLLVFLLQLTDLEVTALQDEVELCGVKGHIDLDVNGVTVDVKSTSPFAFKKFKNGTLPEEDAFGYIEQISGYAKARGTSGAFLAMDKVSGELAYLPFTKEELSVFKVEERIKYLKSALSSDKIPERCYPDEPEGESGNRKLGINCSYCDHKKRCWQDSNGGIGLRCFNYAKGPVWLTHVEKEPKVYEFPAF